MDRRYGGPHKLLHEELERCHITSTDLQHKEPHQLLYEELERCHIISTDLQHKGPHQLLYEELERCHIISTDLGLKRGHTSCCTRNQSAVRSPEPGTMVWVSDESVSPALPTSPSLHASKRLDSTDMSKHLNALLDVLLQAV